MYISRIVIRNFRNFELLDVSLEPGVTCVVGENNAGVDTWEQALRQAGEAAKLDTIGFRAPGGYEQVS